MEEQRKPSTSRQNTTDEELAKSRQVRNERKRKEKLFRRKDNIIRPNDIIVDSHCNKIKLQPVEGTSEVMKVESMDSESEVVQTEDCGDMDMEREDAAEVNGRIVTRSVIGAVVRDGNSDDQNEDHLSTKGTKGHILNDNETGDHVRRNVGSDRRKRSQNDHQRNFFNHELKKSKLKQYDDNVNSIVEVEPVVDFDSESEDELESGNEKIPDERLCGQQPSTSRLSKSRNRMLKNQLGADKMVQDQSGPEINSEIMCDTSSIINLQTEINKLRKDLKLKDINIRILTEKVEQLELELQAASGFKSDFSKIQRKMLAMEKEKEQVIERLTQLLEKKNDKYNSEEENILETGAEISHMSSGPGSNPMAVSTPKQGLALKPGSTPNPLLTPEQESISDPIVNLYDAVSTNQVESGCAGTVKCVLLKINGTKSRTHYNDVVFPEKVWFIIFKMMNDPNDVESLAHASPHFRNLLLPQRVLFLFPKVWSILGPQFHNYQNMFGRTSYKKRLGRTKKCSCGKQRRVKWFSDVLKCRLVCKSWCDGIDEFYGEVDHHYFTSLTRNRQLKETYYELTNTFFGNEGYEEAPKSFLKHFQRTHGTAKSNQRNPFLGRGCYINCGNAQDVTEITYVLQKYGQHIWYCEIEVTDDFPTLVQWYSVVRDLLLLTPNLKHLLLNRDPAEGSAFTDPPFAELIEEINVNHLPKLRNLVTIQTYDLWDPVLKELIWRNRHINRLEVSATKNDEEIPQKKYDLFSAPMENLQYLQIAGRQNKIFDTQVRNKWPLKKYKAHQYHSNNWQQIFQVAENNWMETLTSVTIGLEEMFYVNNKSDMKKWLSLRLQLPNVKKLKLNVKTLFSLDLILPMKESLEVLKISALSSDVGIEQRNQFKLYRWAIKKQVIQYLGWTDRLLESNIWILFPKLKKISVFDPNWKDPWNQKYNCVFTRNDWRRVMAENAHHENPCSK